MNVKNRKALVDKVIEISMKNSTRRLLFSIIILFAITLFSFIFTKKTLADIPPDCGDDLKCGVPTTDSCTLEYPTKCLSARGFGGAEKVNGKSVVCCKSPAPTPTPFPCSTYTPRANGMTAEACKMRSPRCELKSGICIESVSAPIPAPSLYWVLIAYCSPAVTSTPTPTLTSAPTDTNTTIPTPASEQFPCEGIITDGDYPGNYQCASIVTGTTQCGKIAADYKSFSAPAGYSGTTCDNKKPKQGCCEKRTPTPTPTRTTTPTPTPTPASMPVSCSSFTDAPDCFSQNKPQENKFICQWCVNPNACAPYGGSCPQPTIPPTSTLVLALNVQDIPSVSGYLSVELALYNLTTNLPVTGAPSTQRFTLTPIPGKQYSAKIPLENLQPDKYFIVARKGNMIAKSAFTVSGANVTIPVPTTTLVFGDVNHDNKIDSLDYNAFKDCWKNKIATGACASSDFDNKNGIDQIDFTTLMKGWFTWGKEGK